MSEFNSNHYADVYASLGINHQRLGCIMLDVDSIPVTTFVPGREADLHYSNHPDRGHIRGPVAESTAHITLLYGLLQSGHTWKPAVDAVLEGWTPPNLVIDHVSVFDNTDSDEPHNILVAHIKKTPELVEGHQRLSLLPHINTFPNYTPHLTLVYVKPEATQHWLDGLGNSLDGKELTVNRVSYGKKF